MKYINVVLVVCASVVVIYSFGATFWTLTDTTSEPIQITKLAPSDLESPSFSSAAGSERPPSRRAGTSGTARDLFSSGQRPAAPAAQQPETENQAPPETAAGAQTPPQVRPSSRVASPSGERESNIIVVGRPAGGDVRPSSRRYVRPEQRSSSPTRQQPGSSRGGFVPPSPNLSGVEDTKRTAPGTGTQSSPPPYQGSVPVRRQ